ncbi:MAG: hypothetical protein D3903_03680 [Candidatus Electrothrix sp. GM3_4]|nr:hypothetical protein [Candidatus Electrothrix sp. GM3_4]
MKYNSSDKKTQLTLFTDRADLRTEEKTDLRAIRLHTWRQDRGHLIKVRLIFEEEKPRFCRFQILG